MFPEVFGQTLTARMTSVPPQKTRVVGFVPIVLLTLSVGCSSTVDSPTAPSPAPSPERLVSRQFEIVAPALGRSEYGPAQHKLLASAVGCQEWTRNDSTILVRKVVPAVARRGVSADLSFFMAELTTQTHSERRVFACFVPKDVDPETLVRSAAVAIDRGDIVHSRSLKWNDFATSGLRLSGAAREMRDSLQLEWMRNRTNLAPHPLSASAGCPPDTPPSQGCTSLPTFQIVAEPFGYPVGWGDGGGGGGGGYNGYIDGEEHFLEEYDPNYCQQADCDENGFALCSDAGLSQYEEEVLDEIEATRDAYCNASLATPNRVCVDIWIQRCSVVVLVGDCPTGNASADSMRYRARFIVDLSSQTLVDQDVNSTCFIFIKHCNAPHASNSLSAVAAPGGVKVTGNLVNSIVPLSLSAINFEITLTRNANGNVLVNFIGDGFPTFGMWRGANGSWNANGRILKEGSFWDLRPPMDRSCAFELP